MYKTEITYFIWSECNGKACWRHTQLLFARVKQRVSLKCEVDLRADISFTSWYHRLAHVCSLTWDDYENVKYRDNLK